MSLTAGLGSGLLLAALLVGRGVPRVTARAHARARLPSPPASPGPEPPVAAPGWLVARMESADLAAPPGVAAAAWVGAVPLAGVLGLAAGGPGLGLVATAVAVAGPMVVLGAFAGRADRRFEASFPEALEGIARALRGGASLPGALAEAGQATPGRLGDELGALVASSGAGVRLVEALDRWATRHPAPAVRLGAAALALAAETGGASARAVDGVAETIRGRLAVAAEIRALSAQARLSALILVVAPLAFSVLAVASDEGTTEFLLRTPAGLGCLVAGLGLDAVAALWMQRLSRIEP